MKMNTLTWTSKNRFIQLKDYAETVDLKQAIELLIYKSSLDGNLSSEDLYNIVKTAIDNKILIWGKI